MVERREGPLYRIPDGFPPPVNLLIEAVTSDEVSNIAAVQKVPAWTSRVVFIFVESTGPNNYLLYSAYGDMGRAAKSSKDGKRPCPRA